MQAAIIKSKEFILFNIISVVYLFILFGAVQNVQNTNINIFGWCSLQAVMISHKGFHCFHLETDFSVYFLYMLNYFTDLR